MVSVRGSEHLVGLAQFGCGYWGPNLLRSFSGHASCKVLWVVEPREERRAYVRQAFPHVNVTAAADDALSDERVGAIVIATPPASHPALAERALLAGRHVLVEKPLATSTVEADALIALAAAQRRVLMVGHTFLFNTAVSALHDLVMDGTIGEVCYFYSQRLNLGQVRQDVNVWWSLAPHDVSILLHLREGVLPVEVTVRGASYLQRGIEDVAFAVLRWDDGVIGHVHVSWLDPGKVRRVTVVGSRKMVVCDDLAEHRIAIVDRGVDRVPMVGERMDFDHFDAWQLRHRSGEVVFPQVPAHEPLRSQAAHFLACIRHALPALTGGRRARDVVAVLEAGGESLRRNGEPVRPAG